MWSRENVVVHRAQSLIERKTEREKSGNMKLLPGNIKVLFFARGEPHVEVGSFDILI